MTIEEINAMEKGEFVGALGWVFEDSPWVAERTWAQLPFGSMEELHAAMVEQVAMAGQDEQLELIRAHPDLGARAKMSDASTGEQSGAGLDRLTTEEFERLHDLNAAYKEKFGFPFLFAVKGSTKYDILQALEDRLQSNAEAERETALAQIYRIARFRLLLEEK